MLTVDPHAAEPPFEQIRRQVVARVRSGALPAGARLPTVRRLAGDLGVAPGTVARAYRELEAAGLLRSRGRGGTFVIGAAETVDHGAMAAARAYVAATRSLGLPSEEALRVVQQALGVVSGPATTPRG